MTVSVIIVNYNTPDLVAQAVASVCKFLSKITFEIIVVDNASTVGCVKTALQPFPKVVLLSSPQNIGFGRANNLGYACASGAYVLLLNSDAYLIDETSVPIMIQYLQAHNDVGIVGPNFIKADGSRNYSYGHLLGTRKILNDIDLWPIPEARWGDYATYKVCEMMQPQEVGYLAAAGILIKKEVIEKQGLFDPHIFLYFEDMELGWRYKKAGIKSVILPHTTIVHLGGSSMSTLPAAAAKKIYSSKSYFVKKKYGFFIFGIFEVLSVLRLIFKRLKSRFS